MKIVWSAAARTQLLKVISKIKEESPQNSELVKQAILEKVQLASEHPTRYPLDRFKTNNQGDFRAFETHSFRISYRYTLEELRILFVRHIHQKPKLH
ncbi:MAG: type II toxin-antitoxin system RelE/ParE family toxin [Bacteroidota bacterium]